ncbi:MAG: hypothetical protein ABW106_05615 [Steroidobacteraceae bacterium]
MSAAINPYAPPKAQVGDVTTAGSEAEAVRREHIKHETSIRSIGLLYYFSGGMFCIGSVVLLVASFNISLELPVAIVCSIYLVLGILVLFLARGIRNLRPWARKTSLVLSGIGLLGFPVGTLVNGYILYLLLSKQGKRIFEADYPDIVAATPDVKYRTSVVVWVAVAILILAVVAAIVMRVVKG